MGHSARDHEHWGRGTASPPRINGDFCGPRPPRMTSKRDPSMSWASSSQLLLLTPVQSTGEKLSWKVEVRTPQAPLFSPQY